MYGDNTIMTWPIEHIPPPGTKMRVDIGGKSHEFTVHSVRIDATPPDTARAWVGPVRVTKKDFIMVPLKECIPWTAPIPYVDSYSYHNKLKLLEYMKAQLPPHTFMALNRGASHHVILKDPRLAFVPGQRVRFSCKLHPGELTDTYIVSRAENLSIHYLNNEGNEAHITKNKERLQLDQVLELSTSCGFPGVKELLESYPESTTYRYLRLMKA